MVFKRKFGSFQECERETTAIKTDVDVNCLSRGVEKWFMENGKGRAPEHAEKAWAGHIWGRARWDGKHQKGSDSSQSPVEIWYSRWVERVQAFVAEQAGVGEQRRPRNQSNAPSQNLWAAHAGGNDE